MAVKHPKLRHVQSDLRDAAARQALEDSDVLFHLGFQLWRTGRRNQLDGANIPGTANVLAAKPGRVVLASSAAVYGAWPDNPLPLTETDEPRPNTECEYAADKLQAERMCAEAAPAITLRISAVLGPDVDPQVRKAARRYKLSVPAVKGATQALQFLDQDDAVRALHMAGKADATGVFNIATDDWLSEKEIASLAHSRVMRLPLGMTLKTSEVLAWTKFLPFGADRACMLNGPLALSPAAAADALGWKPTRTSTDVLAAALA